MTPVFNISNKRISDFYYEALFIRDRLLLKLEEKYGSLFKAGLAIGKSGTYFYSGSPCKRVATILDICRKTNISIKWVLNKDCNNVQEDIFYNNFDFDYSSLIYKFNANLYSRDCVNKDRSSVCILGKLKQNKVRNISLETLLYFSYHYKLKPLDILFSPTLQMVA